METNTEISQIFGETIKLLEIKGDKAFVGAGANSTKLAYLSAEAGLSGLEWAAGVPGTIGGAIYGNAQAFGTKISDNVQGVEAVNIKTLELKNFSKAQCKFSLKNSFFKENKDWIIASAVLSFKNAPKEEIKKSIKKYNLAVTR